MWWIIRGRRADAYAIFAVLRADFSGEPCVVDAHERMFSVIRAFERAFGALFWIADAYAVFATLRACFFSRPCVVDAHERL